ncbi:pyridoxal-phosphate dependent enzyme [Propioniciclava coleopterorum]|uniref:pyridoxal-phosphate dependent enzyme n=1 Tax=Propioniciclava coleopterorum TaxID=2714937 RepID=UPI001FE60982|nr:pyridoxal-phosphate dependent enzyme [Propioniciclava coleopterorum]
MKYVSTRAVTDADARPFCDILLEGLAPDGGLYVPQAYPHVDAETLEAWRAVLAEEGYAALAARVLELFVDDIDPADLRRLCERAYGPDRFDLDGVVGLTDLGDGLLLGHLSQGPTAAFKDMAMQLLGELFEYELERRDQTLTILGATSGDTGSAAEHAMLGKDRVTVFMLTPAGRMTPFQQAQMFSIDDPAIVNVAVEGVFDDCQDLVKAVNADAGFKAAHRIGAVNSMNWGRVVAQIVYYVALTLQATDGPGQRVSFAVPSGNFGNICAGHVARSMGLPIADLILATNENNVLAEFFATGTYRVRGRPRRTPPPARRWTSPRHPTSSGSSPTCSGATAPASPNSSARRWPPSALSASPARRRSPGSGTATASWPAPRRTPTGWRRSGPSTRAAAS